MTPATYNNLAAAAIPQFNIAAMTIKAIAGELEVDGRQIVGAVTGLSTDPAYLDLAFASAQTTNIVLPAYYTALVYVYEGAVEIGDESRKLLAGQLARLSGGDSIQLRAEAGARLLLITGKPIGEPIVHYGPFVMNSVEQIDQAIQDYNSGRLVVAVAN